MKTIFSIRIKYVTGLVLAAGGLAGIVALVILGGAPPATAENESADTDRFSVLEPAGPAAIQGLSDKAQAWLALSEAAPFNEGGKATSLGTTTIGDATVVVAEVGTSICAFSEGTGMSACGEVDRVERGEIFAASPKGCGIYSVIGILPDGVKELSVDSGDDGKTDGTLPVVSNVYVGTLKAEETVLRSPSGDITVQLPLASYGGMNEACS